VRIIDAYCETLEIKKDTALIHLETIIESKAAKGHYELEYFEKKERVELQAGENRLHLTFKVANPKLWWPNGMGEPHLYSFPLKLKEGLQTADVKKLQFGIRTVELVQEKDSIGTPFYFKINGETVFIKGANYVPQDAFLNRVEDSDYEGIIAKAKEAHFNMLRIWGGGIYEKDLFYELCDAHGILVWQDFMFANSLYPSSTDFQLNIAEEVKENIIRLRKHPSIALWCGNNEIEVAWGNWGWQNQYNYNTIDSTVIWNQQLQLFQHLIPDILKQYYPTANYTSTTPLSNWGTPENFNHSSMHYWGVWHGKEPFQNFKTNVGRFMVEYGFQSFPDYSLLQKSINKGQLHLQSDVMRKRQKSYIGNGMITKHSEKWFGKAESFEDYVVKSQQTQAIAMQVAITQHRLQQPHCRGTLFWQFNDCWPGPSWSVLNYDQSEKIAYQTVKTWYAPVVAIPSKNEDEIIFYITSDKRETQNLTLTLKIKGTNTTKYQSPDLIVKKGEPFLLRTGLKPEGEFDLKIKLEDRGKTIWSTNVPSYLLF
jgi:beta-mannosidase